MLNVFFFLQDLPGSCGITDLHDALSLSELGDRRLFLIATHVKEGETELSSGVQDAQALISQLVCDGLWNALLTPVTFSELFALFF